MMIRRILLLVAAVLLVINGQCLALEKITVAGTGDSQDLLRTLATSFEAHHPGVEVEVPESIGSSGGIRMVAAGNVDLGRVARPIKESEKQYNLHYRQFALTPVVFGVHPGVSINNLSNQDIVSIYSGQVTNWSALGGKDHKIYVADREKGDSSRTVLEGHVPGFNEIQNFAGKIVYSTPEAAKTIDSFEYTIGYLPLSMTADTKIKVLNYNGVSPSAENVQSGKYPLAVPLGIVWKGELKGLAKEFVEYLFSAEGKQTIVSHGDIPAL